MKFLASAALIALAAGPAFAQQTPAPAPAAPATAGAAVASKFNLDTPIEQIVGNAAAKAALESALGADITQNPFYEQIKGMSFNQVQPLSNGQLSDETMKKIAESLAKVN